MENLKDFDASLGEVDLAYQILKTRGEPTKFRDLVQQVLTIKDIPLDSPQLMAAIHTQINLDNRFHFLGQGTWGLKEWNQAKVVRRNITPSALGRTTVFRRRSLQDEMEYEDGEYVDSYDLASHHEDEDDWEE